MRPRRHGPYPCTSAGSLLVTAVLVAALADVLFRGHGFGWNVAAYVTALGAMVGSRPIARKQHRAVSLAAAGLCASVGAVCYRGGSLATSLAVLFLLTLSGFRVANQAPTHTPAWLWSLLRVPCGVWQSAFHDVEVFDRLVRRRKGDRSRTPPRVWRILKQWAVPLALGAVFVALFRRANPLIGRGIEASWSACRSLFQSVPAISPSRLLLWSAAAAAAWALMRPHRERTPLGWTEAMRVTADFTTHDSAGTPVAGGFLTPAFADRCLVLFNAVFAVQSLTDLAFLYVGLNLPDGMTYAEYAHRGAYPLLAAALLSATFTLLLFVPGGTVEQDRRARVLALAWLAQSILLTFSSFWRLHLHVAVYSLTRLRLAACVWMGLVAFGLGTIAWRIVHRRTSLWLVDRNALALLLVLLGCAWWPMDASIARHNVGHAAARTAAGQALDLAYLARLGAEAIPALERHARSGDRDAGEAARVAESLRRDLRERLHDPMAWTWRRGRLARRKDVEAGRDD